MTERTIGPCCLTCHHWDMAAPGDTSEDSGGFCHGRAPGETDGHGVAVWPVTFAMQVCGGHRVASNDALWARMRPAVETEDA